MIPDVVIPRLPAVEAVMRKVREEAQAAAREPQAQDGRRRPAAEENKK